VLVNDLSTHKRRLPAEMREAKRLSEVRCHTAGTCQLASSSTVRGDGPMHVL
jgi:hypothetical protein